MRGAGLPVDAVEQPDPEEAEDQGPAGHGVDAGRSCRPGPRARRSRCASRGVENQTKCWPCQNRSEVRKATGVPTIAQL